MVALDFAAVSIALPSIGRSLGFSNTGLQWVITAHVVSYGGFLLLGGRAADLYGRKRLLIGSFLAFSAATLTGALAGSPEMLVSARAIQGTAAAVAVPTALSLITTTFPEGEPRNRALGIYGALLSTGFAVGVSLGGIVSTALSWRATLLLNVPVGVGAAVLALAVLPPDKQELSKRHLDLAGAGSGTAAALLVIYGLAQGGESGLATAPALGPLAGGLALVVLFLRVERRSRDPLMPPELMAKRTIWGASVIALLAVGTAGASVYVLSLYMQDVLHYTPARAGFALSILGMTAMLAGATSAKLAKSSNPLSLLVVGLLVQSFGILCVLLTLVDGRSGPLLVGTALLGFGLVTATVGFTIIGTAGVGSAQQGITGGLLNSAQQIGEGLVIALLVTFIAPSHDVPQPGQDLVANGRAELPENGFAYALLVAGCLSGLAVFLALVLLRNHVACSKAMR